MPMSGPSRQIKRHRVFTVVALIAMLIGLVGIYVTAQSEFAGASRLRIAAEQASQTKMLLAQFQKVHLDAEAGVRGYAISRNNALLEPHITAAGVRNALLAELRMRADAQIIAILPRLERLSDLHLLNAGQNVRDIRERRTANAQMRMGQHDGSRLMDAIRGEIKSIEAVLDRRSEALGRASGNTILNIQYGFTMLLVAIAILLVFLTLMVSRSARENVRALAQTKQLAAQLNAMFDGAGDGMLLLDERGHILRINSSIERMYGYSKDELYGRHITLLIAETFTPAQSQAWLVLVGKAGAAGSGRKQEFIGKRANGSTFETEVAISLIEENESKQYFASIRDISERKRSERMKSEFISTVSHELRTPLTSIGGSLGLLAGGAVGQLNDRAARLVEIARGNCERLIRLVNEILDIDKMESGKMAFDLRKMPIGPLIKRTVEANRQFAHDHDVLIEVTLPPWPQCIIGDPDRLEQVLTNLVSNAIKHSPAGATVSLNTEQHGLFVRIQVSDRGNGVPEAFRSSIFTKFAMADSSDARTRSGTGLGLAIVREIVEHHGGHAGFVDRPGGGSIFYVDLPLAKETAQQARELQEGLPVVLHIDDDLDCLSVVESAFFGRASLLSVGSLAEARDLFAKRDDIRACIVEVSVDHEIGVDMLSTIRAALPKAPVILFTELDALQDNPDADAVFIKSRTPFETLVETTMALIVQARRGTQ